MSEYRSIDETLPEKDLDEPKPLTDRQARFMFMCDLSQLPREPTFDSSNDLEAQKEWVSKSDSQPREKTPASIQETIQEEEEKSNNKEEEEKSNNTMLEKDTIPPLVIVQSTSTTSDYPIVSPSLEDESDVVTYLRSESPPEERPASRRGSRVDEEEIDLTELGASKDLFSDLVIPEGIEVKTKKKSSNKI